MKAQIKSLLKSYTFKIFIFFFIVTSALTLLISYIIFYKSNELLQKELQLSNKRLLKQIQLTSESYLVDKLSLIIDSCFLDGSVPSPYNTFIQGDQNDPNFHYQLYKNIFQLVTINDFINDFSVYSVISDTCISSTMGLSFHYLESGKYDNNMTCLQIRQALQDDRRQYWISPAETIGKSKQNITFVLKLPKAYFQKDNWNGIAVINLNAEKLFQSINEIYDEQGELFITDHEGHLFAHSDQSKLAEALEPEVLTALNSPQTEDLILVSLDHTSYALISIQSDANGLIYASLIPLTSYYKENIQLFQFILLVLLIMFPLTMFLFSIISRSLYRPFKKIVMRAKDNTENLSVSDSELLENVFAKLSAKAEQMDQFVKENHEILTMRLFHSLASGHISSRDQLNERLFNLQMDAAFFYLLSIDIDSVLLEALSTEEIEFIKYNILQYSLNYFSNSGIGISEAGHRITLFLNLNHIKHSYLTFLKQRIIDEFSIYTNLVCSQAFEELACFPSIFKSVTDAHKYSFLYGYNNIFETEEISQWENYTPTLSITELEQLRKWIISGDADSAESWLENYFFQKNFHKISYQSAQTNLIQIINVIASLLHNSQKMEENSSKEEIQKQFYSIQNISECISWLEELFHLYTDTQKNRLENAALIHKIQSYINEHLEENISLATVSDNFYLSESHLSRLFKDTLHLNFSDYVIEKKLERAAQLLVSSKDLSVSDIMFRLGYNTQSYFSRIFKAKYGVTPTQFRKQSLMENTDM